MPKIATLGSALTDVLTKLTSDDVLDQLQLGKGSMTLITADQFAHLSDMLANLPTEVATGGSAANTALCLAHLSDTAQPAATQVAYICKLNSTDRYGQNFLRTFRSAGVDVTVIPSTDKASGVCTSFVSPDGERTLATYLGAACDLQADDLHEGMFAGADIVYIEGYLVSSHALMQRALTLAHQAGAQVCLDMASYNVVEADHDFFHRCVLPQTDIVFANEDEAAAWLPGTPEDALADLAGRCAIAVVKLGAKGAMARRGSETARVEAMPVAKVVDTTAAGDFFAAGFLHAYVRGNGLTACLTAGAACAGSVIQVMGTKLPPEMWDSLKAKLSIQ